MSSAAAAKILGFLQRVDAERLRRNVTPGLSAKVGAVKRYQQRRFALTYADLLRSQRYGAAASFFLEELYGPADFSARDAQFARVVPALVRLFPEEVVRAVATLGELHALSEGLDTAMGLNLLEASVDARAYTLAWQRSGSPAERTRQIELTLHLGESLDRLTRKSLFRRGLRMMRRPAHSAGLGELQSLLESGFDAFVAMQGAQEFLALVESRERGLCEKLYAEQTGDGEWSSRAKERLGIP